MLPSGLGFLLVEEPCESISCRKLAILPASDVGRAEFWYNAPVPRVGVDFSDFRRLRVALGSRKGASFTCSLLASSRFGRDWYAEQNSAELNEWCAKTILAELVERKESTQ